MSLLASSIEFTPIDPRFRMQNPDFNREMVGYMVYSVYRSNALQIYNYITKHTDHSIQPQYQVRSASFVHLVVHRPSIYRVVVSS
jgi:hypothetical protein